MSVIYSQSAITARLASIPTTIGAGGALLLYAGGTLISTTPLPNPCAAADVSVLTFLGMPITVTAVDTGTVTSGQIMNGDGTNAISGLSVGIPEGGDDITISNGLNSTYIAAGQQVSVLGAEIDTL